MTYRPAIKRSDKIEAKCPIEATCAQKIENSKKWQRCGHFEGTLQNQRGLFAACLYSCSS